MNRRDCIASAALALLAGACSPALAADASQPVILVVGDSISAEYGLARGTGWVALLDKQLTDEKISAKVVNASTNSSGQLATQVVTTDFVESAPVITGVFDSDVSSAATLANKRGKGQGPRYIKDGGKILYPQKEVQKYLQDREILTASD